MKLIAENITRFILLVLIQTLLINNLQILSFCTPFIYILFIINLPIYTPRWLDLILGFTVGISIDMFTNTLGLHTFASVFLAFARYYAIKLFVSEEDRITNTPSFNTFGTAPYLKYVLVLTLVHHTALFALEAFTFSNWWITLARIIVSSIISFGIIIGLQILKR